MGLLVSVWILSVFLNLFLFYSVFQIYFQSPIVQISKTHHGNLTSGIRRVVFFVADGLRADYFFSNPDLHPRLTTIIRSPSSVSGISDTRVPTESRPGHVALFAGLYEDPSAVFTGFSENVVEFDSVFNRSSYSYILGSPHVVLMFAKGAGKEKIHAEAYSKDLQDSMKRNSTFLDIWILDRLKSLARLKQLPIHDKIIIFLNLVVTDYTGHYNKPGSREYLAGLTAVDDIVIQMEQLVNDYYRDDQTIFVFTSDHGMTNWGSHGGGSTVETETPFVLWGKGIKGHGDKQMRLKQADFAALIAGALNIPFPTNSVGRFPDSIWENRSFAYNAQIANFRQIHEMMDLKKSLVITNGVLPFSPFPDEAEVHQLVETAYSLAQAKEFDNAIHALNEAITLALTGINYYERYDQTWMLFLTVYSFLVWMILLACEGVNLNSNFKVRLFHGHVVNILVSLLFTKGVLGWSVWRLLYFLVPFYLSRLLYSSLRTLCTHGPGLVKLKTLLGLSVFSVFGVEILVQTFYQSEILTVGLLITGLLSMTGNSLSTWKRVVWLGSMAILGVFPNADLIGIRDYAFVYALTDKQDYGLSLLWLSCKRCLSSFVHHQVKLFSYRKLFRTLGPLICGSLSIWNLRQYYNMPKLDGPRQMEKLAVFLQTVLVLSVSVLIHFPDLLITRLVSWTSLFLLFIVPVLVSSCTFAALRIQSVFLALATPFCFLSLSYESLFLPALYVTLFILIKLEATDTRDSWTDFWSLRIQDSTCTRNDHSLSKAFRRAWFHVFFVYLSFFGTGNFGSISSFDPSALRCFMSAYNPFLMMSVLVCKIIIPFLLVACFFRLLMFSKLDVKRNFLIVLFLCQGISLHMFFNVTNVGSWEDIGDSLSKYVIVQAVSLVLSIFYFAANILTTGSVVFVAGSIPLYSISSGHSMETTFEIENVAACTGLDRIRVKKGEGEYHLATGCVSSTAFISAPLQPKNEQLEIIIAKN